MSKHKEHKALVGRVKKAVKKTRRKLSEDQFNKELQRTINFLSELKEHMSHLQIKAKAPDKGKVKEEVIKVKVPVTKGTTTANPKIADKVVKPVTSKPASKDAVKKSKLSLQAEADKK